MDNILIAKTFIEMLKKNLADFDIYLATITKLAQTTT